MSTYVPNAYASEFNFVGPSFSIGTSGGFAPPIQFAPEGNTMSITIRTVSVIDGYLGQLIHDGTIVWQSKPYYKETKARRRAEAHKVKVITKLFGE